MQFMTDREEARATLAELGARVRAWRARRGMTRKQLAADSGLSERFLADVETGKGNVSINSLEAAARALNITILELLQDAPRKFDLSNTVETISVSAPPRPIEKDASDRSVDRNVQL